MENVTDELFLSLAKLFQELEIISLPPPSISLVQLTFSTWLMKILPGLQNSPVDIIAFEGRLELSIKSHFAALVKQLSLSYPGICHTVTAVLNCPAVTVHRRDLEMM